MHLPILLFIFFWLLPLNAWALTLIEKGLLAHDMPLCGLVCGGKAAKAVGVPYFDGRGNCIRADYQFEWQTCLKKSCTGRNRRKVT